MSSFPASTAPEMPLPPPYTPTANPFPFPNEYEEEAVSTNITIQSPINIHGSNNVISLPPLDLARAAATIIAALDQNATATSLAVENSKNVSIHFNSLVNVVGDRNIVGPVGFRPLNPAAQQQKQQASVARLSVGATNSESSRKRKASEEPESAPGAKKIETDSAANPVESTTGSGASLTP